MVQIKYFFLLIILVCFISFSFAAPPVTTVQEFPEGYRIVESQHTYLQINQDYQYNFFVFNSSNGLLLDNDTINCTFYLANSSGKVIYSTQVPYFEDGHWGIDILGGNFSTIGTHPYGVSCQDGNGGSLAGDFEINYTGRELFVSQALLYLGMIFIMIFALFINFFGMSYLPAYDTRDEAGRILQISYLKYFRLPLWICGYFLVIAIFFLSSNLALAYFYEEMFGKILFAIFSVLLALSPVVIILTVIGFFVKFFHDREFQRLLNRGIMPGEL